MKETIVTGKKGRSKMKKQNSHECTSFGRKMSNISCDDIETSKGYVVIGSENDDLIYFGECLKHGAEMLKERVKITVIYEPDDINIDGFSVDIDLEDVLRFARKNCAGIYKRVMDEEIK